MNATLLMRLRNKARNDLSIHIDRFFYKEKGEKHDSVYIAHISTEDDTTTEQYNANLYPSFEYFCQTMADKLKRLQRDYILSLVDNERERKRLYREAVLQTRLDKRRKKIRVLRFFRSLINHK